MHAVYLLNAYSLNLGNARVRNPDEEEPVLQAAPRPVALYKGAYL